MANQALTLWIPELDVDFVRRQVCPKNITDQEFAWLIYLANQWKLDPMAREIYITKYGSGDNAKAQVFAGLAGFQKIANRSKQLDGSRTTTRRIEEPLDIEYTKWENNQPVKLHYRRAWQYIGRAVVHKKGCAHPFVVEVQESEYSTGRDLWASKPQTMIKKVALCQALRMAFSISGLYDRDELGEDAPPDLPSIETQAPRKQLPAAAPVEPIIEVRAVEVVPAATPQPASRKPQQQVPPREDAITANDLETIRLAVLGLGWAENDRAAYLKPYGVTKFGALNAADGAEVARDLKAKAAEVQGDIFTEDVA